MGWLSWIVFGALAGWIASLVVRDRRGCIMNVIVGILGAVLAGFIYQWTTGKAWTYEWSWSSFGVACLGAIGLLLIINLITGTSRSRS
ncbi:GlsB/YeaQ/YmgE family stress response membrane protein [Nakamurella sp.]|uniref:GlsB/YeaQ/YmgE family stress response membrane protein n=1 Tax=Nakamurella sp. TaxID=1869182 RepID=UPI0037841F7C